MLAQYADEVCFRCKIRLKGHWEVDLSFVHPDEAPEEKSN